MDDIFSLCREGNILEVKSWLENPENDILQGDEHGFSPLHWACKEGRINIVDLLLLRGALINSTNMGDDTPLHLACSHGHLDIVKKLLHHRADFNAINEHGNTPMHYACFWNFLEIASELLNRGAHLNITNRHGEIPLDKCKSQTKTSLIKKAEILRIDLSKKIPYKDQSWLGTKKRSRDATLSRNSGIDMNQLNFEKALNFNHLDQLWKGRWQNISIVARVIKFRTTVTTNNTKILRNFQEEFPKLRVFSHPNILPVLGGSFTTDQSNKNHQDNDHIYEDSNNGNLEELLKTSHPLLVIISQYLSIGSLFNALHSGSGVNKNNDFINDCNNEGDEVDDGYYASSGGFLCLNKKMSLNIAIDVCSGMSYLHSLNPLIPRFYISSKNILLDENMRAQINISDSKFSFQNKNILYNVNWMSPESLKKKREHLNIQASDMWSFAVVLWELNTKQIPFHSMSNILIGIRMALHNERLPLSDIQCSHMIKLVNIAMNENPAKRPTFDMVTPILLKMIDKI
ncbi:unnamed protein product [Gordionus sp. m RMFG-2023]